ncbi:MAG: sugar kinase [Spirochaetota bacterium]
MKQIVVVGEILVEIMATQADQSFRKPGLFRGPYASGAPAIFIDQVAKFGVPAAIISGVGDDDFGRLCTDRLSSDGVDISLIQTIRETATGAAFVRYNSDGSRNFIYHIANAACGHVRSKHLDQLDTAKMGALHIMGSSIFSKEMYALHEKLLTMIPGECLVSFDPNVRPEILKSDPSLEQLMRTFFSRTKLLFVTEDELNFLTEENTLQSALQVCFTAGIETVVVKYGAEGATAFTRESSFHAEPIAVEEVDPTGAGDTFAGAFLAGYLTGWPVETCLQRANAAGAAAVTKQGPMEGTVTLAEAEQIRGN